MKGVNNPGFQLLSVSSSEGYVPSTPEFSTIPCTLPNQLYIFIIYGIAFSITVICILVANWVGMVSKDLLLPMSLSQRNDDDDRDERWKHSSKQIAKKQLERVLLESGRNLRKIGLIALGWYLWLIWY